MPDFSDVLLDPGLAANFPISSFNLQIIPVGYPEFLNTGTDAARSYCSEEMYLQSIIKN